MSRPVRWTIVAAAFYCRPLPALHAQTSDTTKPYTLAPTIVSVTRAEMPLTQVPLAIHSVDRAQISRAKPTWGLDESLANVPGVYVADRYHFSQDQQIGRASCRERV